MCVNFFFLAANSLFLIEALVASAAELAEHQVSGEEGTKDMVTGSRLSTSVCQLCMCDPSQVTVWVAPSLSPSQYLHPTPHAPSPLLCKVFLPSVEETLQPQLT